MRENAFVIENNVIQYIFGMISETRRGRNEVEVRGKERYQLRHAAGKFWLIDMEQEMGKYRAPVAMNETGAMILQSFWKTGKEEDTAKALSETYEIDLEEALVDVREFLQQLKAQGIAL